MRLRGGIYHRTQVDLAYNSNHIEGSRLTHEQTRHIFETNTIGLGNESVNVDDIMETVNHFRCLDMVIDQATERVTEMFIKELHSALKGGTSDSRRDWFAVGDYKKLPNEVGGMDTTPPEQVASEMRALLREYNNIKTKDLDDILNMHYRFERIHPFQDGNGRVGRLLMFKECLANGIVPFIITDELTANVTVYQKDKYELAYEAYIREEQRSSKESTRQVVLVKMDSIQKLEKAYPNYFARLKDFQTELNHIFSWCV